MSEISSIPIYQIVVGQYRQRSEQDDEELQELTASIKRLGVLQPLIVVRKDDSFLLVAGHQRLAAAKAAGLEFVPAIVRECTDKETAEVAFAENFFRSDLSPVEQAAAIRGCIDEKVMTIEELAQGLHRTQQWIIDQARMTEWPDEVLQAIHFKKISVSAAKNLAAISDPQYRGFLLHNAVENGASARATAAWLQSWQLSRPPEEALTAVPVDGIVPAAAVVPMSPCLFCCTPFRTDALNFFGVCGVCLADFQQARANRLAEEQRK